MTPPPPLPSSTPQLGYRRSLFHVVTDVAPKTADVLLILATGITVLMALGGLTLTISGLSSGGPRHNELIASIVVALVGAVLTGVLFYWSNHFRQKREFDRTAEELGAMAQKQMPRSEQAMPFDEAIPEATLVEPDQTR